MRHEELQEVATAAAHESVREMKEMLTSIGIDVSTPESIIRMQVDLAFLRRQRRASERLSLVVKIAAVGTFISGIGGLIWASLGGK